MEWWSGGVVERTIINRKRLAQQAPTLRATGGAITPILHYSNLRGCLCLDLSGGTLSIPLSCPCLM
jgi:hypothetical protein